MFSMMLRWESELKDGKRSDKCCLSISEATKQTLVNKAACNHKKIEKHVGTIMTEGQICGRLQCTRPKRVPYDL